MLSISQVGLRWVAEAVWEALQLCSVFILGNHVAGSFTGEHWLDQVMQLPNCDSTVLIFTQAGMVHAVAVHQLPTDQGSSFDDLAISKVRG